MHIIRKKWAYYNEHDPKSAAWLRELIRQGHIAPGDVDERSIEDVLPGELAGYTQCHFFAGIGVWSYALRQAGWPDDRPVWTGSCPCQPFSQAGKRGGVTDERHLWPAFHWLISQRKPDVVFGEQVASRDGLAWLDTVQSDMEATGYTFGALDLCAAGFGAPHIRQRLYFVAESESIRGGQGQPDTGRRVSGSSEKQGAIVERDSAINFVAESVNQQEQSTTAGRLHAESGSGSTVDQLADAQHAERRPEHEKHGQAYGRDGLGRGSNAGILGDAEGRGRQYVSNVSGSSGTRNEQAEQRDESGIAKPVSELGDADDEGSQGRRLFGADRSGNSADQCPARQAGPTNGFWSNAEWIYCRDGKYRPTQPGVSPLAHGVAARVGRSSDFVTPEYSAQTTEARIARLRGYGNAIVAPVAIAFIQSYLEVVNGKVL